MQVENTPNPVEGVNEEVGLIGIVFVKKINEDPQTSTTEKKASKHGSR